MKHPQAQLIYFTILIASGLILPMLIQDGMFMDGMIYSTVANNLAEGRGTFWDPHMTFTVHNHFREQPPLTFGILAFFFKVFGNSLYTERIYSFLCAIITGLLIRSAWKIIYRNNEKQDYWFVPVFLFFITPVTFWCYQNNMEENTMIIFDLLAFICFLKALLYHEKQILYGILSGVFISLAVLCKGIQGIFPLAVPFLFYISFRKTPFTQILKLTFIPLVVIVTFAFALFFYQPSHDFFAEYFNARLHNTFLNENYATTENRFYLLYRLFSESLVAVILLLIIRLSAKKGNTDFQIDSTEKRIVIFLLLTGFAGSLPLMVTLEQRGFYLLTSLPYFMMALSILNINYIIELVKRVNTNFLKYLNYSLIVLIIAFTISRIGHIRKHKEMLTDIYKVASIVPKNTHLTVSKIEESNWSLYLYFKRYFNIDIVFTPERYFLKSKIDSTTINKEYKKLPMKLEGFELWATDTIDNMYYTHSVPAGNQAE